MIYNGFAAESRPRDTRRLELLEWGKKYLPHFCIFAPSEFHKSFAADLDSLNTNRGQKLNRVAPRDSAKSTIASTIFALRQICEGNESFIILGGDTQPQSELNLAGLKAELEENQMIARDYPHVAGKGPVWGKDRIVTRNGIAAQAIGSGTSVRGRKERQNRPSLIIIDDPDPDESEFSPTTRERVASWFFRTISKMGTPQTNIVVVGTLIHRECLVGKLQETARWNTQLWASILKWPDRLDMWDQWEALLMKDPAGAKAFLLANYEAMHAGARVLWPERESLVELMGQRAEDRISFTAEKMNQPVAEKGARFPGEWFDGDGLWFDAPPDGALCFCAIDPGVGKRESKSADYSPIAWGWWKAGDPHIYIDVDMQKRPATVLARDFVALLERYHFVAVGVETNGFQGLLADNISRESSEKGLFVPIIPFEHHGTPKPLRIDRLGSYLQHGNLVFRRGSAGAKLAVRQTRLYSVPPTDHDDGPDAIEMLIAVIRAYAEGQMSNDLEPVAEI